MFTITNSFLHHDGTPIAHINIHEKSITIYTYNHFSGIKLKHKDKSNELEYIFSFKSYYFKRNGFITDSTAVQSMFTIDRPDSYSLSEEMKEQILNLSMMLQDKYENMSIDLSATINQIFYETEEDIYFGSIDGLASHERLIVGEYAIPVCTQYHRLIYRVPKDTINDRTNRYIQAFTNVSSSVKSARK